MPCGQCGRRFSDSRALRQHQESTGHCYCYQCDRIFIHPEALEQHCSAVHRFSCVDCDRIFARSESLQQHQKSTEHCYCRECDRYFVHPEALEQHCSALHTFVCGDCDRIFARSEALQQHQKSTGHCYCHECDRIFVNSEALGQHLQSTIHATQFHCCDCDRDFVNEQALDQHLTDKCHNPRRQSKVSSFSLSKWICEPCEREFNDAKGLEQHRSSLIHKPLSDIKCIGGKRCKKRFTSPSALLHHLESGACPSKMTRDKLNSAVQSNDVNRLITGSSFQDDISFMEPDVSETSSTTESLVLTPLTDDSFGEIQSLPGYWEPRPGILTPGSGILTPGSGILTPGSGISQPLLDGSSFATRLTCPLCPSGRKPFRSLEAMMNHLSSPAHSPKLFHCPFYFAALEYDRKVSKSMKNFSTLSGLMQHIESGACVGDRVAFQKTVEYLEQNLEKMGYRKLRLLK
ncbi:hypothetical protein MMC07_003832 [Pseudocyphellaria aurata]|nr:hypothetical protein [Pseudocyphellaria aurata]